MANYDEKEFRNLRFRVDKVDTATYDPLLVFPELKFYPEFDVNYLHVKEMDLFGKIVAYIVYAYDPTSPYVRYNEHVLKRKKESLSAAGFRRDIDGRFGDIGEAIILNQNENINRMIIRFLKILKSSQWAILVSFRENLFKQLSALSGNATDGKEDRDIIANTKSLIAEIRIIEEDFLVKDNNDDLIASLYDTIETDDLDLTPEDIAFKIFMGDNPDLFNPYEQDIPVNEYIKQTMDYVGKTKK